ncbi:hypothetical protein DY240_04690 [Jiangella rhizosphaerae]|uniref:Carbohydrate-binding domain-containing protein n=1 Tax=Jiangella rhizosphaerae TaxID=2293569 RepID=A0A418KWC9_9ACTN|nr:hypothetical protein DY240_04690 [Jiangella rhizosphaerae]
MSAAGMAGAQPYPWLELMLRNEVLDYADIYNYHLHQTYDPAVAPTPLPTGVPAYLGLLEEYDPGDTLGWLTEAGLRFPGTTGRPMTEEEQRALARYQTIWAVTSISQGTDKHFAFVAPPYDEGTGSWGLFEPTTFTPYAGYAAEAAMTAALGEGRYVGRVPGLPTGVTGHVFGDGADSVLVLWAATPASVTLDLDQTTGTLTNIVGASSAVSAPAAGFTVDVGPDPVYLRVAGDVPADTSDAPEPPPTPQPTTFDTADRLVLMQTYPDAVSGNAREGGYALPIDAPTTVTVDVYNFNDTAVTGTVTGTGADGWTVAGGAQPVTVPAGGKATLTFQVSATSAVEFNKLSPVSFRGEFGGDPTSVSTTLVTTDQDVVTARHAFTDDGDALRVAVKNTTGADLHLLNTRWTVGSRRGVAQTGATIPAGETREVVVPLPQLEPGSHTYELRLPFRGGSTLVYHGRIAVIDPADVTDAAHLPITVDGVPDDLSGVPVVDIVEDGKVVMGTYGGPSDLSGTIAVTWDEQNLYLSARITDDVFAQTFSGAETWRGDGIQFSLAPGLPSESRSWDEYDLALTSTGAQLYRRRGTGVPIGVVTAADAAASWDEASTSTVYELALPWTEIPSIQPTDGLMSFSLLVNDNDGAGRKGYIEWGSGIGTGKNPSLFKPLRLVP